MIPLCLSWFLALFLALFLASSASAQIALPHHVTSTAISPATNSEVSYTVSLDNLPTRASLVVDAIPLSPFEDIQLEVRLEGWRGVLAGPGPCPYSGSVTVEKTLSGPVRLLEPLYLCDPNSDTFNSAEVDVIVRVLGYGPNEPPVEVSVSIFGITQVPTNTVLFDVETDLSQQTVSLISDKDTTLYRSDADSSNGRGTLLWAGAEVEFVGSGAFGFWSRRPLRPLLAFDLVETLPFNAQIDEASLRLYADSVLGGGGSVNLFQVAPSPSGTTWPEGNATAPGSQFSGASSSIMDANWFERRSGSEDWTVAGGDIDGSSLASLNIISGGSFYTFSSSQVDAAVQTMVDKGNDEEGFLITGPGTSNFDFADRGVSFASNNAPFEFVRPMLTVTYTPADPWSEGVVNVGSLSYVDEGDNFRWIYDIDQDDVLITDIGGVCEALPSDLGQENFFPYTYSYDGPSYTGLDCCTWQIDSAVSGTIGTGQALFFHNLDASDPANYPPDSDGDGIVDLCDNCIDRANGPMGGTCVNGTTAGGPCNSDMDCDGWETCSQSQQDTDLDGYGDACPVPEPGFSSGLMVGGAVLQVLRRRREAP